MKKFLIPFVAVFLTAFVTTTVFTSCSKSDDIPETPVTTSYMAMGSLGYRASEGTIIEEWKGLLGGPLDDYNNALKGVTSDEKAKQACNDVYDKHMKMTGVTFVGKVEVVKIVSGKTQETIWTKEY